MVRIDEILREKKLTQVQAAEAMGISQPYVSRLLKKQFRDISLERLMRLLTRLGFEIDIVVKAPGRKCSGSVIHMQLAATQY